MIVVVVAIMLMIVLVVMVVVLAVPIAIASVLALIMTDLVVPVLVLPVLVLAFLMTIVLVVMIAVSGRVDLVVPAFGHEIDRPSACVVLAAMPCPVSFITRRYVQVQWRRGWRTGLNHHGNRDYRPRKNELGSRNVSANVDLTIQTGRVDVQRDAYIARESQRLNAERCNRTHRGASDPM
jgi:hypothetical protein